MPKLLSDYWLFTKCVEKLGWDAAETSKYIDGFDGYPILSQGVRFWGNPVKLYGLLIHREDARKFFKRVLKERSENNVGKINVAGDCK